jgi:hypothetical protein
MFTIRDCMINGFSFSWDISLYFKIKNILEKKQDIQKSILE